MRGLYNILNFFIYLYIQHLKLIDTFIMSALVIIYHFTILESLI